MLKVLNGTLQPKTQKDLFLRLLLNGTYFDSFQVLPNVISDHQPTITCLSHLDVEQQILSRKSQDGIKQSDLSSQPDLDHEVASVTHNIKSALTEATIKFKIKNSQKQMKA
ncbi:hypothetical protein BpHYR1_034821 [Brachionus plicatilis]|uniref:RNA-directed DNA polymerase from mobile element jockey-like n=1 Tax=Brachionus plicatilis TaxID=10195 RepID=A0A3M7S8E1_BRAPC|nr:hypothetical protein BpHYR1_034821 [Brachionus plicatilis]